MGSDTGIKRRVALLTIVSGGIVSSGNRIVVGVSSSSNAASSSPLITSHARRLKVHSLTTSTSSSTIRECDDSIDSRILSQSSIISILSSSLVSHTAITCLRGGAGADDDPRRRRGGATPRHIETDERDRRRQQPPPPLGQRNQPSPGIPRPDPYGRPDGRYAANADNRRGYGDNDDRRGDRRRYGTNNNGDDRKERDDPRWDSRRPPPPNNHIDEWGQGGSVGIDARNTIPPPPPPPPPPQLFPTDTERLPIHYMFPTAEAAAEERKFSDNWVKDGFVDDVIPIIDVDENEFVDNGNKGGGRRRMSRKPIDNYDDDDERYRATSPRRDAVTTYMSTRRGAIKVRLGSVVVGATMGGFLGKSLLNDPVLMSILIASLVFVAGFLRNDYGELSRALGLAFVLTFQRTGYVRKEYPTLVHLKAMIRQGPRRPFPPVEDGSSPWKYEPVYRDDPDFKMTYALLAMMLVGSFCGGNVPILPAWMGGIIGAVTFASFTTGANARGDLGRAMGMRLVGLVREAMAINSDLRILGKTATVGGHVFDKLMIMDKKHRIKDKIVAIFKWGHDKIATTAEQVKDEMQDERPERR